MARRRAKGRESECGGTEFDMTSKRGEQCIARIFGYQESKQWERH